MTNYATNLVEDLRLLEAPTQIPWLAISIALAVAILIGWGITRWLRGQGLPLVGAAGDAEVDPSIEALKALHALAGLMNPEHSREFAIEITAIVRLFLEHRFDLRAPQRATEEFLREAAEAEELNASQRALLTTFLRTCDVMKFGRAEGGMDDLKATHEAAIRFVEASRGLPVRRKERS